MNKKSIYRSIRASGVARVAQVGGQPYTQGPKPRRHIGKGFVGDWRRSETNTIQMALGGVCGLQ